MMPKCCEFEKVCGDQGESERFFVELEGLPLKKQNGYSVNTYRKDVIETTSCNTVSRKCLLTIFSEIYLSTIYITINIYGNSGV